MKSPATPLPYRVVMGLDLSLSASGLVVLSNIAPVPIKALLLETEEVPKGAKDRSTGLRVRADGSKVFRGASLEHRVWWLRRQIRKVAEAHEPSLTGIEGHAFGIKNSRALSPLHEMHGAVRGMLFDHRFPFHVVSETEWWKWAIGDGKSGDKTRALEAARQDWPDCPSNMKGGKPSNDIAEAYLVAAFGMFWYDRLHAAATERLRPLRG